VKPGETAVASERPYEYHVIAVCCDDRGNAATEELWENVFCVWSLLVLYNKVIRTAGNFTRCTLVRNLHTAFNLLHVCDYITKLCRQQAEVIQNHENEHVREARHRKYKRLELGDGQSYDRSND
jgi:hypothetical protein